MQLPQGSRRALLACTFVVAVWLAIGFVVFAPRATCNDCNVKYIQARSLIQSGFRSMTLAYPGAMFDRDREFFPFRPPFTLDTPRGVQSIWSPAVILVQTPFVLAGGLAGLVVLSIFSGAIILWMAVRLGGRMDDWVLPIALAFGTCLWYYAVQPWEHAPAIAAAMAGLWLASLARPRAMLAGALLFGLGVVLRDDILPLVPALLLIVWYRHRRFRSVLLACGAVACVMAAAAALDSVVYGRPPGAHLLHAVSSVRSVFLGWFSSRPVTAVPVLSFTDRYNTVMYYWLTSFLSPTTVSLYIVAIAAAAAIARWARSSLGVLVVALVMLVWSGYHLSLLIPRPRSVPSLFPLSPFLVFAVLPAPGLPADTRRRRWLLVAGSLICIVLAVLLTDTAGGKSFGPRLLLGTMPLLTIAAWTGISAYLRAGRTDLVQRVTGWAGVAMVAVAIGINICALRAWAGRIEVDRQALEAVERSPLGIVVADDPFTAQSFMPLYFDKILLLADNPAAARDASALLGRSRVTMVLMVSRTAPPRITLEPYRLISSETVGRMTVQQWMIQ